MDAPDTNAIPDCQAMRVAAKFGGVRRLSECLQRLPHGQHAYAPSVVYRWTYPRSIPGGRGGLIPTHSMPDVLDAARLEGILLTPEDLCP